LAQIYHPNSTLRGSQKKDREEKRVYMGEGNGKNWEKEKTE
jgi:hypothetical protein